MAEGKQVLVTLKDGTKMTLKDDTELKTLSKDSIATVEFFGDGDKTSAIEQPDAGVLEVDAGMLQQQTIATVAVPQIPVKLPEKPPASMAEALPLLAGAIAGAVSSMGMPALTNLVKNLLKDKLKLKTDDKPAEEKPDEPTDCKTHQIKSNAKLVSLSARVTKLEGKMGVKLDGVEGGEDSEFSLDDLSDFSDRIEKIEKAVELFNKAKETVKPAPKKRGKKE